VGLNVLLHGVHSEIGRAIVAIKTLDADFFDVPAEEQFVTMGAQLN
jgi:hypothetical protein